MTIADWQTERTPEQLPTRFHFSWFIYFPNSSLYLLFWQIIFADIGSICARFACSLHFWGEWQGAILHRYSYGERVYKKLEGPKGASCEPRKVQKNVVGSLFYFCWDWVAKRRDECSQKGNLVEVPTEKKIAGIEKFFFFENWRREFSLPLALLLWLGCLSKYYYVILTKIMNNEDPLIT